MNKNKKICFIAHSRPEEPATREARKYLSRFDDVELRVASENLPPFPKSVHAVTLEFLMEYMPIIDPLFLTAMENAEKEGFGAAVVASWGDPGGAEAKTRINIPVVGMAWANLTKAREVGGRFSVFHTHLPNLAAFTRQQLEAYGFGEQCASIENFEVDIYDCLAKDYRPDFAEYSKLAMPLVKSGIAKGARAFVIACGSTDLSEFAAYLNQMTMKEFDVPVLVPIDTMIEAARKSL